MSLNPERIKPGLRFGLLVAMLPVLLLPVLGLWFVGQMAELTRTERRQTQDDAARNFAAALHERSDLLGADAGAGALPDNTDALPVGVVFRATIDGRDDEWLGMTGVPVPTEPLPGVPASTLDMSVMAARSQEQPGELFLLVKARDERFLRPEPATSARAALVGDQLRLLVGSMPDRLTELPAVMHETAEGWLAELTLPTSTRFVRVEAVDVDYQASRKLEATARSALFGLTSPTMTADGLARLRAVETATRWRDALRGFERAGMRVTVHDATGQTQARMGQLNEIEQTGQSVFSQIAARLLSLAVGWSSDFNAIDQDLAPLASALTGVPAQKSLRLETTEGVAYWLTSSAHPIWLNDRVAGALVLEQSYASDLATGQKALEWLALLSALAIAATLVALLALSSLTVSRIVRLRSAANQAIDARGRVTGTIPRFRWHDEVGSLALGYERVLERLRDHQEYLSNLRGRLVHELRTPIMVVRSSLENLQDERQRSRAMAFDEGEPSDGHDHLQDDAFVERALGGTVRLEKIVSSMSEAASLESMLADAQLEAIDLATLVKGLAQAYESAYRRRAPQSDQPGGAGQGGFQVVLDPALSLAGRDPSGGLAPAMVVPETIAQALDKLVSNAADYAEPGTPIVLELAPAPAGPLAPMGGGYLIAVRNQGPALPAQMNASLFDSMVSVRGEGTDDQSHLGLGLYLVRLIAEFHGGRPFAENISNGVRVGFTVSAGRSESGQSDQVGTRVSVRA
ncbi:MAG: ATP-binding protein [Burkholderiaceae bacterium]